MSASRNQKVLLHFSNIDSWEERYKKIINLGKNLPLFPESDKEDKWLVKGCQSQLWLKPELLQQKLIFTGDSDALISKGILALMILFYTDKTPAEILEHRASFLADLGLSQHLSPNRAHGLASLHRQILNYAKTFIMLQNSS